MVFHQIFKHEKVPKIIIDNMGVMLYIIITGEEKSEGKNRGQKPWAKESADKELVKIAESMLY